MRPLSLGGIGERLDWRRQPREEVRGEGGVRELRIERMQRSL